MGERTCAAGESGGQHGTQDAAEDANAEADDELVLELEHSVHLHGPPARKGRDPNRGSRRLSPLAEHLHHRLAEPVDHLRVLRELRGGVDERVRLDEALDVIEAPELVAEHGEHGERARPRSLLAVVHADDAVGLVLRRPDLGDVRV